MSTGNDKNDVVSDSELTSLRKENEFKKEVPKIDWKDGNTF